MSGLQTVKRIGPVLDLFTVNRPEWGVSELATAIGIPRSSAHALLKSLVDTGLLQCRSRGRYRIGWRIVELHQTLQGSRDVKSCAAPILRSLSETYGETTHLAILENYQVMYIDKVIGNHIINVSGARIGAHLDAHCSAVGKALLAQCTDGEIERNVTNQPLRRLTRSTITDPADLRRELRAVQRTGYALDRGEAATEVHCVAAPIRDDMGVVVAAISITAPASRFLAAQREYQQAVKAAAVKVTQSLKAADDLPMETELGNPTLQAAG